MKAHFIKADHVTDFIKDGSTVATVGMTLVGASEAILKEIEESFLNTGHPRNLTLVHSAGQSDRKDGIQHFAHEGLVTRIIGSHWGLQPRWMDMIANNKVEAFCLPQGQIAQLYRSMACGLPGKMSKAGLGTFVDPRIEGGKMNERSKELEDLSEIIHYDEEEYMFYKKIPLDVCIIRGTTADEMGNISMEEEAMKLEVLPAVLATKRFGGKVIVQVKRVAETGALHPKNIVVPGVFVDAIVVCENPEEDHRQTSSWYYDPSYSGDLRVPQDSIPPLSLTIRKFIGRRAMLEIKKGDVINLGTGIPNDVIGKIANEEGVSNDFMITVESGIYGGVQAGGIDFGIGQNAYAMLSHVDQMDYYNGAGVDVTFMGAGELDGEGNVNATKMGPLCTGAGGFIDITQNAKKVVFCATFNTGGAKIGFENSQVKIEEDGSIKKMVLKVSQISFNGQLAREKGQEVLFVTERAVFKLVKEGVMLIEIAPGVDLQKDVLDQMDFQPIISSELKVMDNRLFEDGVFGINEIMAD
ncbi:acyl CoA:acetate/3-ketoacid CoA transferase [Pullulanibacillus sp. KACC 23026]|uniref:acyl CoA:acetate/3-ketoacid CoA transferase n=1 Tax=Pullulanibacillus sp. KACC 23026 TaxID=3028315 RepID=UPI0023AE6F6F|nr:CoA-transferase [Pullulanibacillus sp. KACC 23026]WEG13422.1 acyl CoA:acetate/3-ketoacid CoA transferase [Pullulanibacillus sp. KACC 23026]